MTDADFDFKRTLTRRRMIRIVISINFLFVLGALGLWDQAKKHEAAFRAALSGPVVSGIQLWIVGSTIFATVLLLLEIKRQYGHTRLPNQGSTQIAIDAALVLAWYVTLLAVIAYAFMLGTGG